MRGEAAVHPGREQFEVLRHSQRLRARNWVSSPLRSFPREPRVELPGSHSGGTPGPAWRVVSFLCLKTVTQTSPRIQARP